MADNYQEAKHYTVISQVIKKLFRIIEPVRRDVWLLYAYAIIGGILSLTLPLGVQAIITYLMGAYLSTSLVVLIGLVIGGTLVVGILQIFQLTIVEALQQKLFTYSSLDYAFRIPSLNIVKNGNYLFDELSNRFFDTVTLQKQIPKLILDLTTSGLQMLFGLILISFYHPFFAFFSLLLLLLLFLFFRYSGPKGLKSSISESNQKYKLAHVLQSSGREHWWNKSRRNYLNLMGQVDLILSNYINARKAHFKVLFSQYQMLVLFKTVIISILLIIGGNLVLSEQINLGQFIAAEIVIILIMGAVEKLLLSMENIYDVLTAVDKVSKIPALEIDDPRISQFRLDEPLNEIIFDDVDLEIENHLLLAKGNCVLHAKENIAFIIPEGSYRNLFLRALQGFIPIVGGRLLVNGHESQRVETGWWRKHILYVERAALLYNTSIASYLGIQESDSHLQYEMDLLSSLGILNELKRWNQSLFEPIEHVWLFNFRDFLWRLGLARHLLYQPQVLLINAGELSAALKEKWIDKELLRYRETGIWLAVASEDDAPKNFRKIKIQDQKLSEII